MTFIEYFFDQISLPPSVSSPYDDYLNDPSNVVIFGFLVILIGPVFEEIIFRQHICSFLESNISSKFLVIILSGIIFSLNHLPADLLNDSLRYTFEHLFVLFVLGLFLGVIYYKYGLLSAIFFHSFWNTFSFLSQTENLILDPALLSNILLFCGLILITIFPIIILYRKRQNVSNIKDSVKNMLFSQNISLYVFTNAFSIIIYELLIAILLITQQSLVSMLILFGIHTLGIILGFIVVDTDLRVSNNARDF